MRKVINLQELHSPLCIIIVMLIEWWNVWTSYSHIPRPFPISTLHHFHQPKTGGVDLPGNEAKQTVWAFVKQWELPAIHSASLVSTDWPECTVPCQWKRPSTDCCLPIAKWSWCEPAGRGEMMLNVILQCYAGGSRLCGLNAETLERYCWQLFSDFNWKAPKCQAC